MNATIVSIFVLAPFVLFLLVGAVSTLLPCRHRMVVPVRDEHGLCLRCWTCGKRTSDYA